MKSRQYKKKESYFDERASVQRLPLLRQSNVFLAQKRSVRERIRLQFQRLSWGKSGRAVATISLIGDHPQPHYGAFVVATVIYYGTIMKFQPTL